MEIQVFAEGKTEEKVIEKLKQFFSHTFQTFDCRGKDRINEEINKKLGPSIGQQPVRALILRDLDDGENNQQIIQSISDGLIQLFLERKVNAVPQFQQLPSHKNVFIWKSTSPDFHIAVHIADYRWNTSFTKRTIDDLVLQLALDQGVAAHLAQKQNVSIGGQVIIQKVTQEIPMLLQQNGFPPLSEAKDYVRLYAAVIRMHTSPPVFAANVLASASNHLVQQNFASIIEAIRAL
ncbi:MAG: hypothetical protein K6T87_04940 [Roseiflexus sp.]|uniref:hypothetical protein n=1 Tax=Roseiflexus sp. TaxID=2562120 RepID=UPI0025E337BA|nr:hypothetical protein [Roseiflexus sp.]MCL6539929.1 hypothetical protein [Roseiflexus sp.]